MIRKSKKTLITSSDLIILHKEYHKFIYDCKKEEKRPNANILYEKLREEYTQFKALNNKQFSNKIIASRRIYGEEEWPNLEDYKSYLSPKILSLVKKSIKSSLLAVEIYNKPTIDYRSEGYIVLMMVAWTSLFHAIFLKNDKNIEYEENDANQERFLELRKCIDNYTGKYSKEIRANLLFLCELRDKIVHRNIPDLDDSIFGECQACLLNFEQLLIEYFGNKYTLRNTLAYSLQFSQDYKDQQYNSIKKYHLKENIDIINFINTYRENLESDVFESPNYSFRVFMIPKVGNHLETSDLAVEYIKYDPSKKEEYEKYENLLYVIKEKRISGDYLKAGEVADLIYNKLKNSFGNKWKFNASFHHSKCTKYFKVRDGHYLGQPEKTNTKYCIYDPVFEQHIYTRDWVELLAKKLKDKDLYKKIMATK